MIILGINGGVRPGYQDTSAVLTVNGEVIAAVEEERLNRIKHAPGQWPYLAILEVLKLGGIRIEEVDIVATHGSTWGDVYQQSLQEYFHHTFNHKPQIVRYHHHLCHAASTYFASGFDKALILTADSSGDGISLQIAIGTGNQVKVLEQLPRSASLGLFYSMMTQYCGFTRDTDEYKLMGLAPYGEAGKVDLSFLLLVDDNSFHLNEGYIHHIPSGQPQRTRQQKIYNDRLILQLGEERLPHEKISKKYMDVAAATQKMLEMALLSVIKKYVHEAGITKLCMAGGIALNCAANKVILESGMVDKLFVQPASGDAGISLGAAWLAALDNNFKPVATQHTYLGRQFTEDDILKELEACGIAFEECRYPAESAAESIINDNKVVGWFQGGAEFGPRALGNRSILANAYHPEMKDIINKKIKFREGFRPFCPSVLKEDFSAIFSGPADELPYMTINTLVRSNLFPAITHVDNTARVQTVSGDADTPFCRLLHHIKRLSSSGITVNTSFNRSNEPMVYTPRDAISVFYGSGLDELYLGPFRIRKQANQVK